MAKQKQAQDNQNQATDAQLHPFSGGAGNAYLDEAQRRSRTIHQFYEIANQQAQQADLMRQGGINLLRQGAQSMLDAEELVEQSRVSREAADTLAMMARQQESGALNAVQE